MEIIRPMECMPGDGDKVEGNMPHEVAMALDQAGNDLLLLRSIFAVDRDLYMGWVHKQLQFSLESNEVTAGVGLTSVAVDTGAPVAFTLLTVIMKDGRSYLASTLRIYEKGPDGKELSLLGNELSEWNLTLAEMKDITSQLFTAYYRSTLVDDYHDPTLSLERESGFSSDKLIVEAYTDRNEDSVFSIWQQLQNIGYQNVPYLNRIVDTTNKSHGFFVYAVGKSGLEPMAYWLLAQRSGVLKPIALIYNDLKALTTNNQNQPLITHLTPDESELFESTSGVIQDFESSLEARIKKNWDEDN